MLTQYLILIIIGAIIGMGVVLSIVKAIMSGFMMNGGGMMGPGMMPNGYYPPNYHGSGLVAAFGSLFVFLVLFGAIYLAYQVRNNEGPFSTPAEQPVKTWVDELQAEDSRAPQSGLLAPDLQEGLTPASNLDNRNSWQNPSEPQPAQWAGIIPTSFGFSTGSTQQETKERHAIPEPKEENYYVSEERFYIQAGAGSAEAAALEAVRRLQRQLPGRAWLGVKEDDAELFKFLVGPFSDSQSAQEAQGRWGIKGFVRDAGQDGIEVFSVN